MVYTVISAKNAALELLLFFPMGLFLSTESPSPYMDAPKASYKRSFSWHIDWNIGRDPKSSALHVVPFGRSKPPPLPELGSITHTNTSDVLEHVATWTAYSNATLNLFFFFFIILVMPVAYCVLYIETRFERCWNIQCSLFQKSDPLGEKFLLDVMTVGRELQCSLKNWTAFAWSAVWTCRWLNQMICRYCPWTPGHSSANVFTPAGTPGVGDGSPVHPCSRGWRHHWKTGSTHQAAVTLCRSLNQGEWRTGRLNDGVNAGCLHVAPALTFRLLVAFKKDRLFNTVCTPSDRPCRRSGFHTPEEGHHRWTARSSV